MLILSKVLSPTWVTVCSHALAMKRCSCLRMPPVSPGTPRPAESQELNHYDLQGLLSNLRRALTSSPPIRGVDRQTSCLYRRAKHDSLCERHRPGLNSTWKDPPALGKGRTSGSKLGSEFLRWCCLSLYRIEAGPHIPVLIYCRICIPRLLCSSSSSFQARR